MKEYLRADEKIEDLTEEREKELRGMEQRDRRLMAVVKKGMVFAGQDIHIMTKAKQDKLIKLESPDRGKKAINTTTSGRGSQMPERTYTICSRGAGRSDESCRTGRQSGGSSQQGL